MEVIIINIYTEIMELVLAIKKSTLYVLFISIFFVNALFSVVLSFPLGNTRLFTNSSNSMLPAINTGDITVVKKNKANNYRVGDIVTFYLYASQTREILTHRITGIGGNVYITKGDNNPYGSELVLPYNIIGKVIAIIPYIGYYAQILKNPVGNSILIAFPCIIIIYTEIAYIAHSFKD